MTENTHEDDHSDGGDNRAEFSHNPIGHVSVYADATVTLPLVVAGARERIDER